MSFRIYIIISHSNIKLPLASKKKKTYFLYASIDIITPHHTKDIKRIIRIYIHTTIQIRKHIYLLHKFYYWWMVLYMINDTCQIIKFIAWTIKQIEVTNYCPLPLFYCIHPIFVHYNLTIVQKLQSYIKNKKTLSSMLVFCLSSV